MRGKASKAKAASTAEPTTLKGYNEVGRWVGQSEKMPMVGFWRSWKAGMKGWTDFGTIDEAEAFLRQAGALRIERLSA